MNDTTNSVYLQLYLSLREEIQSKINIVNNLITATIAAVWLIISSGFSLEHSFLFVLALLLIIPLYTRIIFYNSGIARISSYLIIFLESKIGVFWETRNSAQYGIKRKGFQHDLKKALAKKQRKPRVLVFVEDLFTENECVFLGVLCVVAWLGFTAMNFSSFTKEVIIEGIVILLGFFVIIVEWLYDRRFHRGKKGDWIAIWQFELLSKNIFTETQTTSDQSQ